MVRATIDYGIDLGTTNSSIAVGDKIEQGTQITVVKNNESMEYTPSAVYIDKAGRMYVGRQAKERVESDPRNAFSEFKLEMGTNRTYQFASSGREMKPQDLSAEVLKSLKGDVRKRRGEEVRASVITVPAAFDLPQCDATQQAARLAGIDFALLLQEPVAAAMAYGFESDSDKVFWMVYDFGGGTFDAAVMHVRDGLIQVVNHGGDRRLGGKLLDWMIVEELLIPALTSQFQLTDFRRGNEKWIVPVAKLKGEAEDAKIRLSQDESAHILIDPLCEDDQGRQIVFEYDLQRADVVRLAEPLILRSINICRQVLSEKRLGSDDIEKLILVGGPTLMPYLRERLADPKEGLGIPLDFSLDPLTVVARGAAIYAGTHPLPEDTTTIPSGRFAISFPEWKFRGSDTELLLAGTVQAPAGQDLEGFTVEFTNTGMRSPWRSGKIALQANGAFWATLLAEKKRLNTYQVELCDSTGTPVDTVTRPAALTYEVGLEDTKPPLTHSVGIEQAGGEVLPLLRKGAPLPARKREILVTVVELHQGTGDPLRIPVCEGEHPRADRNRYIGHLEITAQQVKRDVPAGSEVEFTIEINESRLVTTKAYIPILDEEFEKVLDLAKGTQIPDVAHLTHEFEREKERLKKVTEQAHETGDAEALRLLDQIERERTVHDVETLLDATRTDPSAATEAELRLLNLKAAIDAVEKSLEWPVMAAEEGKLRQATSEVVQQYGNEDDRQNLRRCETETDRAMQTKDVDLLRQCVDNMQQLMWRVLDRAGVLPVLIFQHLCGRQAEMTDQSQASRLIAEGQRALQNNDIGSLRSVNDQLRRLLPVSIQLPWSSVVRR